MSNFDIKISIHKLAKVSPGLKKTIGDRTFTKLVGNFSNYVESVYLMLIEEAIYSKKYQGNWEPVGDIEYLHYIGTEPSEPILDLLKKSLRTRKVGYNFLIDINPIVKYPGSKLSVFKVVRSIEYGTTKFKSRPILSKIVRRVNKDIVIMWKAYLAKRGVIM